MKPSAESNTAISICLSTWKLKKKALLNFWHLHVERKTILGWLQLEEEKALSNLLSACARPSSGCSLQSSHSNLHKAAAAFSTAGVIDNRPLYYWPMLKGHFCKHAETKRKERIFASNTGSYSKNMQVCLKSTSSISPCAQQDDNLQPPMQLPIWGHELANPPPTQLQPYKCGIAEWSMLMPFPWSPAAAVQLDGRLAALLLASCRQGHV